MPEWKMAKEIVVDRHEDGAPRVIIDGFELPWYTTRTTVGDVRLNEPATLTVTIIADKVTQINDAPTGLNPSGPVFEGSSDVRPATVREQLEMPTWSPVVRLPEGG